jgi:ABC-type sugar transport system ATPase subunit
MAGLRLSRGAERRNVAFLSGGNQQKAMLARWAHRQPRVLLADEPTRGIDVGAKATIMRSLAQLAAHGLAMLVVSSDHEELLGMADRIVVIARGRIVAELDNRARSVTEEHILQAAFAAASCTEEVPGVDD